MEKSRQESFWEKVIDTMGQGVLVVNSRGRILFANDAVEEITGYRRSELIGQPCAILRSDACFGAASGAPGSHCELFQKGSIKSCKGALVKKDGGLVHILKNAVMLEDGTGQTVGVETLTDISEMVAKERVISRLRREISREDSFQGMIGKSPVMDQLFCLISSAAQSDAPVIIYGESGVGKELAAAAIHRLGERHRGPFIKVNSAALAESILESELFGHVRGAFTGAERTRAGRFEAAHGGDIFLDEVGDLPLATQAKLLRVLQEKVVERVGDHRPIPVDVRIISATNQDLPRLIAEGRFREDLFYRINVIPIHIPPLRERREDIPLLVEAFIERNRLKTRKPISGISKEALDKILAYRWPGNVRELINAIDYAFVLCHEGAILPKHLPGALNHQKAPRSMGGRAVLPASPARDREALMDAMEQAAGNKSEAARILGVSRVTLWKWLKNYQLNGEDGSAFPGKADSELPPPRSRRIVGIKK
ncbi:MAG: sigma 54-interacting transcriptional regulator [Deltaproteobacteria bacterium]|nr:sigma 54-interacting transcriptional regulator [Deltaproteobacteria bacterium]